MIDRGPIKGEDITFAPAERIEAHEELVQEFMTEVFGLMPGEYLITDESDIRDFTEAGSSDTSEIWKRIDESFGVAGPEVMSGRLVDILDAIARSKHVQ